MKTHARKADTNMRPFFVIVHAYCVSWWNLGVRWELRRIRKEEDYVELYNFDSLRVVHIDTPDDIKILVCGAFGDLCVASHVGVLKNNGYNAEIYKKATVYSRVTN